MMEKFEVLKVTPGKEEEVFDSVTEEVPLTVFVNDEETVTLLSSPTDLAELAVGFVFTSGLIRGFQEIKDITVDTRNWAVYLDLKEKEIDSRMVFKRMFTSGCGRGTLFYNAVDFIHSGKVETGMTIDRAYIFRIMMDFQARSRGFMETGGVHGAMLADTEKILISREDIGRHNAIDKILGYALMKGMELSDKIVLSSGRVSSEIVLKIQKAHIPLIVSRSAPTNQAIRHARKAGITLIGFARGKRMNVYSGRERVL